MDSTRRRKLIGAQALVQEGLAGPSREPI